MLTQFLARMAEAISEGAVRGAIKAWREPVKAIREKATDEDTTNTDNLRAFLGEQLREHHGNPGPDDSPPTGGTNPGGPVA